MIAYQTHNHKTYKKPYFYFKKKYLHFYVFIIAKSSSSLKSCLFSLHDYSFFIFSEKYGWNQGVHNPSTWAPLQKRNDNESPIVGVGLQLKSRIAGWGSMGWTIDFQHMCTLLLIIFVKKKNKIIIQDFDIRDK